jgi:hypothetical protein
MDINIKHNIEWWNGGIDIDFIIRKIADKLGMIEGNYSKYSPCYLYLQYEKTTMNQFKLLKKRINTSKKLKDIKITVEANNVQ